MAKGEIKLRKIQIFDTTLLNSERGLNFKENLEICRLLQNLCVDTIELDEIKDENTDVLFVKTASAFVKDAVLSVKACSIDAIDKAVLALENTKNPRIRIELPVSAVTMEYFCQKKPEKMLSFIKECVEYAKTKCADVEFCAVDATRAEKDFLNNALTTAVSAGATMVSLYDSACEMLPDAFSDFIKDAVDTVSVPVGVKCDNANDLSSANSILSVSKGASYVKTCFDDTVTMLVPFASMIKNNSQKYDLSTNIKDTEMLYIVKQINKMLEKSLSDTKSRSTSTSTDEETIILDKNDSKEDVLAAVKKLGYVLTEEDENFVYDEFVRFTQNKAIGSKELDAIVASTALQVPSTYKLVSYVTNSGNTIAATAQISLEKDSKIMQGVCVGNGPIDAAFLAIEDILGTHYELDDFQIDSVTRGKEAIGSAVVRLRSKGKLYSGNGISTNIIGAAIRAYLNAINKIAYEEN